MPTVANESESVFSHKAQLYEFISKGVLTEKVVKALLPEGEPLAYERQLWDYKLEVPCHPHGKKLTEIDLAGINAEFCEVIKDAVAFHNSYGGYLVVGVRDKPREIVGMTGGFDVDELNKRIVAATGQSIECYFKAFSIPDATGVSRQLGLLFVPQRPDHQNPIQFIKDAAEKKSGKKSYAKKDIYFRFADQCIRAETSDHYAFLCTPGRRVLAAASHPTLSPVLDSNLGARDPGFIEFVGRSAYLATLWKWLLDRYNPVKLLAGIGGVGKTALAREFCEQIGRTAPFGLQKIVWLSAKRQFYSAVSGKYVPASRIDFDDADGVLRQICGELGLLDEEVPIESSRDQLIEAAVSALTTIPALVVVDDIDSLEPEQQQDVFHTLIVVFGQTVGRSPVGSRALLTARLDLGAAPAQVVRVKGLEREEFIDFVDMTAAGLDLNLPTFKNAKRAERLHRVTEGSPAFASSILRLVALGESLDQAMTKWEHSDGEEVRRFAFERELEQLADSATNVLYALCILSDSTLIELGLVLTRTEQQVRDDIAELRKYHLVIHADEHLPGGTRMSAPGSIRMMREILKRKVKDPRRIENSCARARSSAESVSKSIGPLVSRIVSLWANDRVDDALALSQMLDRQHPNHPDVKCLLGRAHMRLPVPNYRSAEVSFRKAQELGCRRPELLPLWIETKAALDDWGGILDITKFTDKDVPPSDIFLARLEAYKRLADIDRSGANFHSAAERYLDAGKEIDRVFKQRKAAGMVLELKQRRKEVLFAYFDLIWKLTTDPDDFIDVWLAAVQCFESFVRSSWILRAGSGRLRDWWRAVEGRSHVASKTAKVMNIQLKKLSEIVSALREQESPDNVLIDELEGVINELGRRLSDYQESET